MVVHGSIPQSTVVGSAPIGTSVSESNVRCVLF